MKRLLRQLPVALLFSVLVAMQLLQLVFVAQLADVARPHNLDCYVVQSGELFCYSVTPR